MSANPSRLSRRREAAKDNRERESQILDAVEHLLSTVGYDALTMALVAEFVGIHRSSAYFYFDSKQTAVTAVVSRVTESLVEQLRAIDLSNGIEPSTRLAIEITASIWRDHTAAMRCGAERGYDVPAVGQLWKNALEESANLSTIKTAELDNLYGATQLIFPLTSMIERSFARLHAAPHTAQEESQLIDSLFRIVVVSLTGVPPAHDLSTGAFAGTDSC